MPVTTHLDWLYHLLGYTLAAAGILLLLWALFWDRSRGRRRCPKCWYDMAGVPGLKCPECGKSARREESLLATRRRKRWGVVAVIIGLAAYGVASIPAYRKGGWVKVVPSSVLVYIASSDAASYPRPPIAIWNMGPGTRTTPSMAEQLANELEERLIAGQLARWQSAAWLNRFMKANAVDPGSFLRGPQVWPTDQEVPVRLTQNSVAGLELHLAPPGGNPSAGWGSDCLMPAAKEPCDGIDVEIRFLTSRGRMVHSLTRRVTIDIKPAAESKIRGDPGAP